MYDTWHLTLDTWHLTGDMWHVTYGWVWAFSQNLGSPALTVWDRQYLEDIFTNHDLMNEWMNELINYKCDCRTAPPPLTAPHPYPSPLFSSFFGWCWKGILLVSVLLCSNNAMQIMEMFLGLVQSMILCVSHKTAAVLIVCTQNVL